MVFNKYLVLLGVFMLSLNSFANVTVTSGGNLNICVGTTYTTIGKITIAEGAAGDFSGSTSIQIYEINAPSNFEFNPGNGSVTATGADITFSALTVTSTKITLYYLLNATATTDKFELTNIQIRATNPSGSQNIVRTGGNAVQAGNNAYGSTHASVSANQAYVNFNLGSQSEVCINEGDITLSGGNPGGGTYSGTGVNSGATFDPSSAGVGTYVITYSASQNGCTGTATATIKVNPKPSVTFFGLDATYCSNGPDDELTGFPSGGTFSGSIAISGNLFRPSVPSIGNKNITYSYTDINGCSDTYTLPTTILQAPSVSITLSPDRPNYSSQEDSILISGTQSNPSTGGDITVTGNGVSIGSDGKARFYPNIVGQGTSTITRTLTASNSCSASASKTVTVSATSGTTILGLSSNYCIDQAPVTISVPNGTVGYFTGPGINEPNIMDNTATFDPSMVSGEVTISFYTYNALTFSYFLGASQKVTVHNKPSIQLLKDNSDNSKTIYCSNDDVITFSAIVTPPGGVGVYKGTGVSNNSFNPKNALIGPNTLTYSYTDIYGCVDSVSMINTVNPAPSNVGFIGLDVDYCSNEDPAPLTPNSNILPAGGKGNFSSTGGLDSNSVGKPIFNPAIIVNSSSTSKNYTVSYIYTTSVGCSVISSRSTLVYKTPEVNLNNLSSAYCFSKDTVVLSGSPGANAGTFSIGALAPTVAQPSMLYNKNRFVISTTTPGTYYLTYTYKDPTSQCTSYDTDTTIIRSLPSTSFTNLDTSYCVSSANINLFGSPIGGTYSSLTASLTGTIFKPSDVGKHSIMYTYTDDFGCSASMTKNTTVYGVPMSAKKTKPQFKLSTVCEKDLITLSDSSSQINTDNGATSFIKSCYWKIDNITYSNTFKNDTTLQLSAGSHKITYQLLTDKNCTNATIDSTIIIGSYPQTGFTWDKICNKEDTKFINTSGIVIGNITDVIWNFGDGNDSDTLQTPTVQDGNIIHKFQNSSDDLPSTYTVSLTARTNYNCVHTETQKVFILPAQRISSAAPYVNDFNINNGGWIASSEVDTLLSWTLDAPHKKFIKSDNPAWVTNDKGAFKAKEVSYVYSPCFTLDDDITKPMIHMDIWSGTRKNIAGANLQYSVDGTNFLPLGEPNASGVNWYNNESNIASRPSGTSSLDQNGWTGIDSVGWKNARHVFDDEIGINKNIRFRISFAATEDTTTDGFAFDNMWIGDRTRLILAEHFTNNSSTNTLVENSTLNNLVEANLLNNEPKDIVKLEYHTAFPAFDQINARNIPDAGARSLYYGVTQIPYTSVDGSYYKGNTLKVSQDMIDTRALYDPAFDITLNPVLTPTSVSGSVTIKNKIPVANNVTVYISMLERFVNGVSGKNGESSYQWVHSKFLPDAAGTSFAPNWGTQNSQTVNFNWNFGTGYLYNPEKLAMIAFVQDNVTKEIYQTAYKGLGATVSTGVFDPAESTSTVSLYPNPADNSTAVALSGKLSGTYNWLIVDEMGRVVDEGTLTDGTDGFIINTTNYTNGFYTLRLSNSNAGVKTQKFVVIH